MPHKTQALPPAAVKPASSFLTTLPLHPPSTPLASWNASQLSGHHARAARGKRVPAQRVRVVRVSAGCLGLHVVRPGERRSGQAVY